ncbi:MAG: hypothetical protein IKM30_08595 [Oscillospiraceae bacterium]|nr:hypothetical protein [Oscillospiraceae bacterium]
MDLMRRLKILSVLPFINIVLFISLFSSWVWWGRRNLEIDDLLRRAFEIIAIAAVVLILIVVLPLSVILSLVSAEWVQSFLVIADLTIAFAMLNRCLWMIIGSDL